MSVQAPNQKNGGVVPPVQVIFGADAEAARRPLLSPTGAILFVSLALLWAGAIAVAASLGIAEALFWSVLAALGMAGLFAVPLLDRQIAAAHAAERDARRMCGLLYQIVNGLPSDVQIKDRDLRYRWINAEYTVRRDLTLRDIAGKTPDQIGIDPAQAAAAMAHDRRVLESGQMEGPEEQFIVGEDGTIRHISMVTKFPLFEHGVITHIATVGIDLTTIREDQRLAEEARRLLETVMQSAPITIQVTDRESRVRWANRAFRAHFGWLDESPIGRLLADVAVSPALMPETLEANRALMTKQRSSVRLDQYYPATGERPERYLRVTKVPIHDAAGEVARVLTMGIDVTAQKRAEAAADDANRLMDSILANVPLSIQVKDRDLRIRWANSRFGDAVHREPDWLLGKTLEELGLPADAVARTNQADRAVLGTGETAQFNERWVSDGVFRHMMVVKAPMLSADGRATHVVTIGADVTEVHRLRAEAEAARRQLQIVLDAVPVTIALKDTDRRFQWVNREFERVHGASAAVVLGHRAEEFVADPALTAAVAAADEALLATGIEPPPMQQPHVFADGTAGEWSARRVAVRDAAGAIEGILVVGVNVTELSRATDALRRMNEELETRAAERAIELAKVSELVSTVIESAPVPIVTFRLDGGISGWNPAAEALTGISATDALAGRMPPRAVEDQAAFDANWRTILAGESISNVEARWRGPDGRNFELAVSGAPLRRADGTIDGVVAIWLNVTPRKRIERELAATRDNLLDAVESVNHAITLYDRDDRTVLFNHHYAENYNEIADLIEVGTLFEDRLRAAFDRGVLIPPNDRNKEAFIAEHLASHRRANGTKFVLTRNDGRTFEVWENRTRNGGIISVGVEVTEQRRLEQQLRHAQRMEAVGQLTGGIAHDFNNLLAVVIGNLDLLLLTIPPDGEERQLVDQAIEAAERGAALTGRLLAFARRQTLRPMATDVDALVTGMLSLLRRAVGEAITIECVSGADLWLALIDAGQLESAILNLTVNARDAMPDGGKLKIATRNTTLDDDYVVLHPDAIAGEYVCVSVSDTGTGISAAILGQVFEPFFSTKETGKGSGLGLSMVFGFVKQSGGHVRIYSEVDFGTTVSLYLPRVSGAVASRLTEPPVVSGHGETILLVEDNVQLRKAAANMVSALGYRVLTAEDAESALAVLDSDPAVDLLFSDVVLPGGRNGFELARDVLLRRPDMAVVFTSGFADPTMVSDKNPDQDAVILTKPYRRAELAETLRWELRRRKNAL